jgi:hypothetical protein
MTVTDLNDRRAAAADTGYEGIMCPCGDAWFTLGPDGAVVLDVDGTVSGYVGTPRCMSCGAVAALP